MEGEQKKMEERKLGGQKENEGVKKRYKQKEGVEEYIRIKEEEREEKRRSRE